MDQGKNIMKKVIYSMKENILIEKNSEKGKYIMIMGY